MRDQTLSPGAHAVLTDLIGGREGAALWAKRIALVVLGVAVLAVAAKIRFPLPPSPVPITMQTFVVLSIGAAYGPRLAVTTILAYLAIGALGFDVFTSSSADRNGLEYMLGGTGGYLVGYALAALALGWAARRGWDRGMLSTAGAMALGTALIYAPGVAWLAYVIQSGGLYDAAAFGSIWEQTLAWGLTPFLIGDAMKLALAVLVFPFVWRMVGRSRA